MKSHLNLYNRLKVAFIPKILMRSTYPQIDEPNYFHALNILKLDKKRALKLDWKLRMC